MRSRETTQLLGGDVFHRSRQGGLLVSVQTSAGGGGRLPQLLLHAAHRWPATRRVRRADPASLAEAPKCMHMLPQARTHRFLQ